MADEVEAPAVEEAPEGQSSEAVEATEAPEVPALDIGEYGEHIVTVKVDGEEQAVPLKDALLGYQRHADYTRKTQELASEREAYNQAKQLWDALTTDYDGTIQQLQALRAPQPEVPVDPVQAKIAELDAWRKQQELNSVTQQIQTDLSNLHETFGDFDDQAVMQRALELNTNNLKAALLDYRYDFEQAQKAAEADLLARNGQAESARTQAKAAAAFVEGGSSVPQGATGAPTGGKLSVEDAFRAAIDQLG